MTPLEIPNVFSPDECGRIVKAALAGTFSDAGLVGGMQSDNTRRSRIFWLDEEGDSAWTFRRLLDTFADANRRHFDFRLEEFAERMQVAWYGAEPGGFFDWHVDFGDGPTARRRKLTVVVQLSPPDDYDGGTLINGCRIQGANTGAFGTGAVTIADGGQTYLTSASGSYPNDFTIAGIRFFCTPSTCIQFKPEVIDFALDEVNPGYRRLKLYSDGKIESEVIRIDGSEFRPDFNSEGY